jgi:ferric-dicitrate binding protein FerR (iron transport regulator)
MHELFIKYLNNDCSPAEVRELLAYFNVHENEDVLRGLIIENLENIDADDDESKWVRLTNELYAGIKEQLNADKPKVVPIVRRTWFRVAAAAVFLLAGFAVYNAINNTNKKQDIVQTSTSEQEIAPGSNRAVLTLADGSTIILENAVKGPLTQQGYTKISKPADGQLEYKSLNEKPKEVLFNNITTPRGGQYQLILSDGSKVWLNAASSLRFPAAFGGNERKVEISGEAYFEVAKDASRPFKVDVPGKGEVEVLGTHFNVNAYRDEPTVKTTLLEGSVKVMVLATRDKLVLNPGEQAQLQENGQITINKNADTEQALAWKTGSFHFSNADLGTVFRQLSRWYDVDVSFEGPIPQRQFDGEIQRDLKLSQVLKLLEKNNVFCRLEGKRLIVLQ